ncbi:S8 family serine peptidase [Sphaerotilus sp.]|uniref:S8 family peptidase n=1 Tax=Sphaerotilus sp. TaxID=2093942 RepID=UPI0034E2F1C7
MFRSSVPAPLPLPSPAALVRHLLPVSLGATLALAACGGGQEAGTAAAPSAQPMAATAAATATAGRRHFIVVLRNQVIDAHSKADELTKGRGGQLGHVYSRALRGFSVSLPDAASDAFVAALENHADVDHIEPDVAMSAAQTIQPGATWGLDRVDQRALPLSTTYSYSTTAAGISAYIIDTGILASHTDFGGRVRTGFTAITDGNGTTDCNGHGTHVAGTVGSATWGMAKGVGLVPVRVLDCAGSGTASGVIAGIDWVVANAVKPAVGNLSLVGGVSAALDTAVANAVASGITMVVAAGNDGLDACNASPARTPTAITVGATTSLDTRASYSNWGTCLDLFAPGDAISSTGIASTTASAVLSGTSMAAPHVAGLAALALATSPAATPAQIASLIQTAATPAVVTDAGTGSPNLLAYTGVGTIATPPVPLTSVSVGALGGKGIELELARYWQAGVTIGVRTASGLPVVGAVVAGDFTIGGTAVRCTTSANGKCNLTSGLLTTRTAQTVFQVTGITGTSLRYDTTKNVAGSITIRKP